MSMATGPDVLLFAEFDTPFGPLGVVTAPGISGDRPAGVDGPVVASGFRPVADILDDLPFYVAGMPAVPGELGALAALVADYVAGQTGVLDLVAVHQRGPAFADQTWRALREVPAGTVISYGGLANAAGRPRAARAVGSACATNNVAPFVPCHRVIKSDGSIGEYGFTPEVKVALLRHEGYADATTPSRSHSASAPVGARTQQGTAG